MRTLKSVLLGLCAIVPFQAALASPLMEYNDIDLSYEWTSFDEKDADDGHGLDFNFRYSPGCNFFLETGYNYINSGIDTPIGNLDFQGHAFRYGGGGYYEIQKNLHAVARVGGIHTWTDVESAGNDENDAIYLGGGLRFQPIEALELDANVTWVNFQDSDPYWVYNVTGLVPVTDSVAALAAASLDDDNNLWLNFGARLGF